MNNVTEVVRQRSHGLEPVFEPGPLWDSQELWEVVQKVQNVMGAVQQRIVVLELNSKAGPDHCPLSDL